MGLYGFGSPFRMSRKRAIWHQDLQALWVPVGEIDAVRGFWDGIWGRDLGARALFRR